MPNPISPRVIRVTSLAGFCQEVLPFNVPVRLNFSRTTGEHSATLTLTLQGVNEQGEIVWLTEQVRVAWLYGEPFGGEAKSQLTGMHTLLLLVKDWLTKRGYEVREGDYALPDNLRPLAASFSEAARWVRDAATATWRVEPVEQRVTGNPAAQAA